MGAARRKKGIAQSVCTALVLVSGAVGVACAQQGSVEARLREPVPGAPSIVDAPQAVAGTGIVTGTVTDIDGRVLPSAQVVITLSAGSERRTVADENGFFRFEKLPAGAFRVTVTADGLAPVFESQTLKPGEDLELGAIMLVTVVSTTTVDVSKTREEIAEVEIHQEEQQRLLGVVPNFFVSYNWDAQPLTVRQKFQLDWKTLCDPVNFVIVGASAGIQQADDAFPGFHQGFSGYAKRYGSSYADFAIGTTLGGSVFPALFHQDPRYFYKGTGTKLSRALYALSTAVRQRGDNGKWQVAYSSMMGDLSAGAISNLYYPASDRQGATLTLENGFLSIAFDGVGNLVQEFLFKPFSTGVKKTP